MIARLSVLCCVACGMLASLWAEKPMDVEAAAEQLRQLRADIMYLADDDLRGRSVADETIEQAAKFIAERMSAIGLDTDVIDGQPFQQLSVNLGARPGSPNNNRVTFTSRDSEAETIVAGLGDGMNPMAIGSRGGKVTGPVVFAGYGITAPKLNYDDYKGIDVSGAIVIILRKEPRVADPHSPFDGVKNTRHAFFATKIDAAIKNGAAAVILVNDPGSVGDSVQKEKNKLAGELKRKEKFAQQLENLPEGAVNNRKTLTEKIAGIESMIVTIRESVAEAKRGILRISDAGEGRPGKDSIPVISLARDLVDKLLRDSAGRSLDELQTSIDETLSPQSVKLDSLEATLQVDLKPSLAQTSNVIGVLDGRGELGDQTIVVGAHYDHVGMGGFGSLAPGTVAVHNGADDNASGTAAMLSIAAQLIDRLADADSHRRLVFIAFTGEERGLVGSKFYVRNPRFPIESTVAMVNLDMVGRLRDNELTVYGTGSGDLLDELVEKANERQQFKLYKVQTGYGPSDHQSFYEAGVPVLFFFSGLHNDYHRPSDDFEKIDFGGLTRITDIVSEVTFKLAVGQERPEYAETEKRFRIRRHMTAFIGVSLSDRGDHVVLSGLAKDGPAERGGLRIGDRLNKLADRRIRAASDVLELMRSRSPGDKLKVQVIRGGKTIDVTIRLDPRPDG